MINPSQLLEVTLYSKLLNELTTIIRFDNYYIVFIGCIYLLYQITSIFVCKEKIAQYANQYLYNNTSSITIEGHRKVYQTGYLTTRQIVHILYSDKFRAITHFLFHHKSNAISNFKEAMKMHYNLYEEESIEYVMMPAYNQKILVCPIHHIYIEISVNEETSIDEKDKHKNLYIIYHYKLSVHGNQNYPLLNEFLEKCILKYNNDVVDKKKQMIFEFISSYKDDNEKVNLQFNEYPFKSNKLLDKNIYFEGKEKLIKYVDKFKANTSNIKSEFETEYENAGVTFKASMLFRGSPGCGKSCTIRAILNRTGRHGVVVSWSKLKTCSDFCKLFRTTKINDKTYSIGELCFIFEDFDANASDILKKRNHHDTSTKIQKFLEKYDSEKENAFVKNIEEMKLFEKKMEDELTLECVLNVLDGIIELHNAMIIFTTNHIDHIDPAFIRSGRIDFHQEFKLASLDIIKEMLSTIRNIDCTNPDYESYFDKMVDYTLSPADIQNICFKYTNIDAIEILNEIVALSISKQSITSENNIGDIFESLELDDLDILM
jgi:hypothetical protein